MIRHLKNKPLQIVYAVLLGFFIAPFLSINVISFFYSLSECLKEFLMLILPFLIFFCLSSVLSSFKNSAPLMVLGVLILVILSNGMPLLAGYAVGVLALPTICEGQVINMTDISSSIVPLFSFPFKSFIKNEWALVLGLSVGILVSFIKRPLQEKILEGLTKGKDFSILILQKGFIPFLPFYVFGFILKMNHDGALEILANSYSKIFMLSVALIFLYIGSMYFIASNFNIQRMMTYLKNMFPAGLTGFSTMSGIAALPISLESTEKNLNDKQFSQFIVPATVNIHMAADGLNISLTALSLLIMTNQPLPDLSVYMLFVIHYCLVKFSAVGAPGGGVIVVLPVLHTYLGLSPELTGLLATIYILQDALMTASNVMANGALSIISYKIFKKVGFVKND